MSDCSSFPTHHITSHHTPLQGLIS